MEKIIDKIRENQMTFVSNNQKMSKQKFYTPLIGRKKKEEKREQEQCETLTTQAYGKRGSIISNLIGPQKIKSNPSFSLDKISTRALEIAKTNLIPEPKRRDYLKLPSINRNGSNPEDPEPENLFHKQKSSKSSQPQTYYQSGLARCLRKHETSYLMSLYRQHFYQCVEVLRQAKSFKVLHPRKEIKLSKKNPSLKTVYLDLDETLVHCDENSNNYTVKLNFPLERGGILAAGVRIRPYCREFLTQLSQIAQVIIFTASAASYADVILDHLDPQHKLISHRLYRQHCTLQKGYFLKDLRVVNRRLSEVVLVDNSPYCHILQPENGVPMLPFYHYAKDRELQILLQFLKTVVAAEDTRKVVMQTFFWDKYMSESGEPRRLFFKYFQKGE